MPEYVIPYSSVLINYRGKERVREPGKLLRMWTTGIATSPALNRMSAETQSFVVDSKISTPMLNYLIFLQEKIHPKYTLPTYEIDISKFTEEQLCCYFGAQLTRGERGDGHSLTDEWSNFTERGNMYMVWYRENSFHRTVPETSNECSTLEDILLLNTISWPSITVLWDSQQSGQARENGHKYGTLKESVLNELITLGLGRVAIAPKTSETGKVYMGRPPRVFVPNKWGIRFCEILGKRIIGEPTKYALPEDARRDARKLNINYQKRKAVQQTTRLQKLMQRYHAQLPDGP